VDEGSVTVPAVRQALAKILASAGFAGSDRLSQFLRFIVEETLAGRGEGIKDYVIGVEVYRKAPSYDPRTDSSVRGEASRLRVKLNRYYETVGANDDVIISVPKGTYVPIFTSRDLAPAGSEPAPEPVRRPRSPTPRRVAFAIGLPVAALGCAIWIFGPAKDTTPSSPSLIP
jgi:hypothetical protein